MRIRFCKGDGTPSKRDTLVCVRDDGTSAWTPLSPGLVYHDLMHYVAETTLDCRRAFYGLIQAGWDIEAFTAVDPVTGRRPDLPAEAWQIEYLVVLFPYQAAWDETVKANYLALVEAAWDEASLASERLYSLSGETVDVLRHRLREYYAQWEQVPPGGALELPFPANARYRQASSASAADATAPLLPPRQRQPAF